MFFLCPVLQNILHFISAIKAFCQRLRENSIMVLVCHNYTCEHTRATLSYLLKLVTNIYFLESTFSHHYFWEFWNSRELFLGSTGKAKCPPPCLKIWRVTPYWEMRTYRGYYSKHLTVNNKEEPIIYRLPKRK